MESRWRKRYFTCSAALSVVSQAVRVVGPRLQGPSGDVVSSFDATGLLLLAFIGAAMGSVVLGALGALFWLRDGLRGDWHIDVAVASAFNALPLVYVALHEFLGTPF